MVHHVQTKMIYNENKNPNPTFYAKNAKTNTMHKTHKICTQQLNVIESHITKNDLGSYKLGLYPIYKISQNLFT